MFQYRRKDRVQTLIRDEISYLLQREIKDPRLEFVTITRVKVSEDLQHATVFISVLGDEKRKKQAMEGLTRATGFIRREIGSRIKLRLVPEIIFKYDDSIEGVARIHRLLNEIRNDKPEKGI